MNRRRFVQQGAGLSLFGVFGFPSRGSGAMLPYKEEVSESLSWLKETGYFKGDFGNPADEKLWGRIQALFPRPDNFCQLEHGYFSHSSLSVRKFHQERENYIGSQTSFFMRREQERSIDTGREALAGFFGWPSTNLALTRNTTESLNTVFAGFPWRAGDEIVYGDQDYGSMTEAIGQATQRYQLVNRIVKVPMLPKGPDEVVEAYLKEITPQTRMLHLTHLINLTGQVVPVEAIAGAARQKAPGICIVVDAAHSVAHIEHDWKNTDADIVAGSLHKWMCNPLGLGFLYMKSQWIPEIWPLMADLSMPKNDIRRFEHQGTRPIQTIETLPAAIELNALMGGVKNKQQRLRYLQESWTKEIRIHADYRVLTPDYPDSYGAIATLAHETLSPTELSDRLWEKHRIFTVAINHPVVSGVRVTPHLSNDLDDLKKLKAALLSLS